MTERTCEHSYLPYEGCPYCKEYRRGLEVGQSTTARLTAELAQARAEAAAVYERAARVSGTDIDQRKEPTP